MPVRDPHEPVIPGNENHAKREASHHSMPIGSQRPLRDPHDPVLPEKPYGYGQKDESAPPEVVKLTQVPVAEQGEEANEEASGEAHI